MIMTSVSRDVQLTEDEDDFMYGDGEGVYIGDATHPVPMACVLHPSDPGRAYFFCSNLYALININVAPASTSTADVYDVIKGPDFINRGWPSLSEDAGFAGVDAILPVPGHPSEMYFFLEMKYSLLSSVQSGSDLQYIAKDTQDIATGWQSLNSVGFEMVDAILPSPTNNDEAYFFSNEEYALVNAKQLGIDYIVSGPRSIQDWVSLRQAGFTKVVAALPSPDNPNEAFIFSNDKYVRINLHQGVTHDQLVFGPSLVAEDWPGLREADFY